MSNAREIITQIEHEVSKAYDLAISPLMLERLENIEKLLEEIKLPSDTCTVCGCNEFLCGHNKRG